MTATNREKEIYGSGVEIVCREDGCTVFGLATDSGGKCVSGVNGRLYLGA